MIEKIILLLDMDAFFAAIEELHNPQFRGKPIVVGADPKEGKGRGVVSTCNYEARKYGIHSAMPISKAWRLCPKAVFLPADLELYSQVSARIMEIIQAACLGCPIERVSLDEAYIDLSLFLAIAQNKTENGAWKNAQEFAKKLRQDIWRKEKLACSIGIGPNKMTAKIACEKAKPNGVLVVEPQNVQAFLDPLPIRDIPGVGPKTALVLGSLIRLSFSKLNRIKDEITVKDVRVLPLAELRAVLGKHGEVLYERARGIDKSSVAAEQEAKSIGKEHTFEKDTRDGGELFPVFRELVGGVIAELKEEKHAVKTVTVVCRFSGFETHTKSKSFKKPLQDWSLFEKEAMRLLLRFLTKNLKPVRLVGVRAKVAKD